MKKECRWGLMRTMHLPDCFDAVAVHKHGAEKSFDDVGQDLGRVEETIGVEGIFRHGLPEFFYLIKIHKRERERDHLCCLLLKLF